MFPDRSLIDNCIKKYIQENETSMPQFREMAEYCLYSGKGLRPIITYEIYKNLSGKNYKEDSNVRTVEDFKKNVLSKWNLSNKMKEELEEKLMPMVLNEGASKIFGDHVFVEPKKGEGEWFLEIIFVHSEMFRIKKVVYLKLHSKGWLLKPRACAYGSKGGGNRYCWKRGYKQDEIDIITKTLELKAFEAVKHEYPRPC